MKRGTTITYSLMFGFIAMAFIPSCGSSSEDNIAGPTSTSTTVNTGTHGPKPVARRECTSVMGGGVDSAKLQDFLQPKPQDDMSNIEPPVTYCFSVGGSNATLRIEFEANSGIFYTKFTTSTLLYARRDSTSFEVIYMDGQGLVGVKGSGNFSSGIVASVKYYNFPSYEDALAQAEQDLYNYCHNHPERTAECMGFGPPTVWWNDSSYQPSSQLTQARNALNDSSKTSVLGTILVH